MIKKGRPSPKKIKRIESVLSPFKKHYKDNTNVSSLKSKKKIISSNYDKKYNDIHNIKTCKKVMNNYNSNVCKRRSSCA